MLSFFRRFATSPIGIGLFSLILIAFVVTLYEGKTGFSGANLGGGGGIASVGSEEVGEGEVRRRVQTQLEAARQQQPGLDLPAFIAGGGVEQTIDQIVNGLVLEVFARQQGMVASKRLVDGAIASIPAFSGPTGTFDRNTYLAALAQRKIPEAQLRGDFAREALTKMLLLPVEGAVRVPTAMVDPYASLLLEARSGQIGVVPSAAFATLPPPSDQDVKAFYVRNLARYTLPERRVVRYAVFDRNRFAGKVDPSEAEIGAFYASNAAAYAARETRSFTQIIVPTKDQAAQLEARVKAGMAMAAAAKSIGRSPLVVPPTEKAAFEKLTSPAVADAAFKTPRGAFAPVIQSGLGFHLIRVEGVSSTPAKSLAEARPAIVAQLTERKIDEALSAFVAKLGDEVDGGSTFDEVARKYALTPLTTPAVTPAGSAPEQPEYKPAPELAVVLRDAFQAEPNDPASVVALGEGKSFALWHLDRVVAPGPRPFAQVRDQVAADARLDVASRAARKVADAIAANVNRGMPFAQAIAAAGVKLPAPQPAGGKRLDIAKGGERVPAPLALMFSMTQKHAKVLGVPEGRGWYIVYLDRIERSDAALAPGLIEATRGQLSRVVGEEYVGQFVAALKAQVGSKRDVAAIASLKRSLSGGAPAP